MTNEVALKEPEAPKAGFDDVMLAMDIVDTLRHRTLIVERELAADEREGALIERLREIYKAQGIEVPDHILKDGVKALEEKRFVYAPKKGGASRSLAMFYISRDRWLKPVAFVFGLAAFATGVYEFGFDNPREARAERAQIELSVTLPSALTEARDRALSLAETDHARRRLETAYQDGAAALSAGNANNARAAIEDLQEFATDLSQTYSIRVVSRPGEYSGVFRIPNDAPDARNYYLIVEAVDAAGKTHTLEIESEEDNAIRRVASWGVRVPEGEFNRIAADKQDDQIIQNNIVGQKPKGALLPDYTVPTAGGAILEW